MKFIQILSIMLISTVALSSGATFVFSDGTDEFNFQIHEARLIQHALDLISGETTSKPHIMGIIIESTASYNSAWSYHLEPTAITFFDTAPDVCNASIAYTEKHFSELGTDFLPGNRWCPWTSYIVREIST